jgi:hypothetical protein
MLSQTIRWSSAVALMAAAISVSLANAQEERRVQKEPQSQQGNEQMQTYRAKQVIGSKVSIENNMSIGTVDDIVFADDGYIEYMIVQNEKKLVTVPWEAAKFNFEKRTAMVNIAPERFKEIPTYTAEQYPVFSAPDYRVQTYKYYGLTPRQERRAVRRGVLP